MVTPASQSITFGLISNQSLGTGLLSLNGTASSGLAVAFKSTTLSVCTGIRIHTDVVDQRHLHDSGLPGRRRQLRRSHIGKPDLHGHRGCSDHRIHPECGLPTPRFQSPPMATRSPLDRFPRSAAGADDLAHAPNDPGRSHGNHRRFQRTVALSAPLFYVSPTQINFLIPEGLAIGGATVTVTNSAGAKAMFTAAIAHVSPALFTADSSGTGAPAAIALANTGGAASTCCRSSPAPYCRWPARRLRSILARLRPASIWSCMVRASADEPVFRESRSPSAEQRCR